MENPEAIPNQERSKIALEATWEIEALTLELVGKCKTIEDDKVDLFSESLVIKSVLMRIKELNSIIMSSINDAVETNDQLRHRLG